jgi:hypothetical protein
LVGTVTIQRPSAALAKPGAPSGPDLVNLDAELIPLKRLYTNALLDSPADDLERLQDLENLTLFDG